MPERGQKGFGALFGRIYTSWYTAQYRLSVEPNIDNEVVNQADAMHQLYVIWGYDASANDALCQNAARVNLICRQGNAPLATMEKEGYPWISEIKTADHLNYVVVARVEKNTLDLLVNNRTWQVSKNWFNQHATGNYTLLHRLTPQGKDEITAASSSSDMKWLNQELSQSLNEPITHSQGWTADLAKRTREFQERAGLHVDGIVGEETLMQLMRATNSTPDIMMQTATVNPQPKTQGKPQ
ncbi:peptidoglycan-binding protein [Citrobacter sp. RHB25-C09]|nr:peptidoglycan-binding protein [Citrobacter sp. RHB25-C09]